MKLSWTLPLLAAFFVVCWQPLQTVEPRSGPTESRAWSGSKLFDTLLVFLKKFLEKVNFEKSQQTTKKHAKIIYNAESLTLCMWETPKWVLLQTVKTIWNAAKCAISSGSALFVMVKKALHTKKYNFFQNYNLTPLDMYNELSQVYLIKQKKKNPLGHRGLSWT